MLLRGSGVVVEDACNVPVGIVEVDFIVGVPVVVAHIVPALEGTHHAVACLACVLLGPRLGVGEQGSEVHAEESGFATVAVGNLDTGAKLRGHVGEFG